MRTCAGGSCSGNGSRPRSADLQTPRPPTPAPCAGGARCRTPAGRGGTDRGRLSRSASSRQAICRGVLGPARNASATCRRSPLEPNAACGRSSVNISTSPAASAAGCGAPPAAPAPTAGSHRAYCGCAPGGNSREGRTSGRRSCADKIEARHVFRTQAAGQGTHGRTLSDPVGRTNRRRSRRRGVDTGLQRRRYCGGRAER